MRVIISRINGMGGIVGKYQSDVARMGHELGFDEMSIFRYPADIDDENELAHRLDGVIAGVWENDVVIIQYPTWNEFRYEERLISRLRGYRGLKIVIFVQDVVSILFKENYSEADRKREIGIFNAADVLILPSEEMYKQLVRFGLRTNIPIVYQELWDCPMNINLSRHGFERRLIFTGDIDRFPFIKEYDEKTRLEIFGRKTIEGLSSSVIQRPFMEQLELLQEISKGGFGLVWSTEEYFEKYYSKNQPYKLGTFIAAGIPVIIQKGSNNEKFILDNKIGFAVESLKEADTIVSRISEEEYAALCSNVKNIQELVVQGLYTKKALVDAVIKAKSTCDKLNIKVKSIDETLDYVLANGTSVARFGDGEIDIIAGKSIPYQDYNEQLANYLRAIIAMNSNKGIVVCLPPIFEGLDFHSDFSKQFWSGHMEQYNELYKKICTADWYGNTFISRPYIDLRDKIKSEQYFRMIKDLWNDKDILIVEGTTTRSGVGNDLFDNAKSVKRIIGPSKNAFSKRKELLQAIEENCADRLVLLMLGPTAKILVHQLYLDGIRAIDIGHIDSEYEWFKMGATERIKLSNKHTAEFNYDENISFDNDIDYENQIICKVE